jgi:hypothetical protein
MLKSNEICSILIKFESNFHEIFIIEGEKNDDSSVYIVQTNHVNHEVQNSEKERRKFYLQKSYHSRVDTNGLVRTHMKRNGKRFGLQEQKPLNMRVRPLSSYGYNGAYITKFPIKSVGINDIIIELKEGDICKYEFVFMPARNKPYYDLLLQNNLKEESYYMLPLQHNTTFTLVYA